MIVERKWPREHNKLAGKEDGLPHTIPGVGSRMAFLTQYLGISEEFTMTEWLINAVEVSNLLSFCAVLLTFTVMFFYIVRLIGEDLNEEGGSVTHVSHNPPRVNYTRILIPFTLAYQGIQGDLSVEVMVRCVVRARYRVFWGVDITAFHQVVRAPDSWFRCAFSQGNLFGEGKCRELGTTQELEPTEEKSLILSPRSKSTLQNLGRAPRDEFPLVVVILGDEDQALVSVIHMRDADCPVPSQVLSQHFRHSGTVTLLQPLYLESRGESSDTESQEESDTEETINRGGRSRSRVGVARCVICQEERISRVILPCRHAASCSGCFTRLKNRCPMCRGFIQSYFLIRAEPPDCGPPPQPPPPQPRDWRGHLGRIRAWIRG